jgi:hypothetical protein
LKGFCCTIAVCYAQRQAEHSVCKDKVQMLPEPHFRSFAHANAPFLPILKECQGALRAMGYDPFSLLHEIDRVCARSASALHTAEAKVYALLACVVIVAFLLFPSKDDPDRA